MFIHVLVSDELNTSCFVLLASAYLLQDNLHVRSSDLGYKQCAWLGALLTRHRPRVRSFVLNSNDSPVGISFLDLLAHSAISLNVHSIINKTELDFPN